MPTYVFLDTETEVIEEVFMSISAMEEYVKQNPTKSRYFRPSDLSEIVSGVAHGKNKPDDTFRDILRQIKKNNHRSNINIP